MAVASFHFHGYQPGDIVRWVEPDPLKPPRFEERRSPVSHRIGPQRIEGRNWTDAVLHAYGRMEAVLEDVPGVASVDVEPQTLVWLLERDADAYRRVLAAWEKGVAGLVLTPPFHAIVPHHDRFEREVLFDMMIDFYAPIVRRVPRPIGLWLPEAAYSADALHDYLVAARRGEVAHAGLPDLARRVHLLLDARQVEGDQRAPSGWYRAGAEGMSAFVRDPELSGEFAFGASKPEDFAATAKSRVADSSLVASDLESLLANPAQAERFEGIVAAARAKGLEVRAPSPAAKAHAARIVNFSSWSDYDEHLSHGHTSDTRWTGIRRWDGLVVSRRHRGARVSQLWKHAFMLATERVETAVRRTAHELLRSFEAERRREILQRLAVAYGRHVFGRHYRALGSPSEEVDFARAAERISGGKVDVETLGHLARAYTLMLMGLRSDPRFWDNLDTRVAFQNVVCLTQSVVDTAAAREREGDPEGRDRLFKLLRATLLDFSETYGHNSFAGLRGVEGWEVTEAAWLQSLQSEVPHHSGYDVVRRATLFALEEPQRAAVAGRGLATQEIVADTGHIVGELHGEWSNADWCEHRTGKD